MLTRLCLSALKSICLVAVTSGLTIADEIPMPPAAVEPMPSVAVDQVPGVPVDQVPHTGGFPIGSPVQPYVFQAANWSVPGTVGETYTRPSHPIPVDEHPRTAMLAVRDKSSAPILTVERMGGFRMKSGVWLFESERPLDHGRCQIVRVEARETVQDIEPTAVKFVRLIPGRIVYLDF